jgi:hypothetical protein
MHSVRKPEVGGTRLFVKPRHRRQNNIKGMQYDGFWIMGLAKGTRGGLLGTQK